MSSQGPKEEPILFLWSLSAWAAKITAYLALRRIPHARCEQPITQPRPDLASLGVNYRRIPLLSLGRDIYCDTLLILEKLEALYPPSDKHPGISAKQKGEGGTVYALERLLEKWTDTVVFQSAAVVIPSSLDLMKDPQFQKDREELWGRPWSQEEQDGLRPKGMADLRSNFQVLEDVLADGRSWIAGGKEGDGPGLADIHSAWIFDWLNMIGSYSPEDFISSTTYPRTFAWLARYSAAIDAAKKATPEPPELSGPDAVTKILGSGFQDSDAELKVKSDPEGFKNGEEVEMWPTDTGYNKKDSGKLVKLDVNEMAVSTKSEKDGKEVRVHYPRWNFQIRKAGDGKASGQNGEQEFVTLN